jgi:hypothetical protein
MDSELKFFRNATLFVVLGCIALIGGCLRYEPEYRIWSNDMAGKAALAYADQQRQIRVAESKAKLDAAELEAKAEVVRAEGSAKANKIMAESLSGAEADRYLRLRWIIMMEEHKDVPTQLIYLPNDSLPVTEAGRGVLPIPPRQ